MGRALQNDLFQLPRQISNACGNYFQKLEGILRLKLAFALFRNMGEILARRGLQNGAAVIRRLFGGGCVSV